MELEAVLAIAGFFSAVIIFIYMFFSGRHKVRMALIEQGKDASIFQKDKDHLESFKYGLVAIAAGIGLLIGNRLDEMGMPEPVAYFSMILILGGAALVAFYMYARRKPSDMV